jgi:16S rRNA (guanine527-N7)-methyltransferase
MQPFEREELTRQLAQGASQMGVELSDVQIGRLIEFLALLTKWNAVYNLTAVRDPGQMVVQHLLDSLSILPALGRIERLLDVGAGGGLPGMVIAIWAAEKCPQAEVAMVDTVHKKTAFLTQVKAELGLKNVSVYTSRVEQLQGMEFDVITSRAFAELKDFVTWSGHLLAETGRFIAMKGLVPHEEMGRLPEGWRVAEIKSLTVPGLEAERHLITIERS